MNENEKDFGSKANFDLIYAVPIIALADIRAFVSAVGVTFTVSVSSPSIVRVDEVAKEAVSSIL